MGLERLRVEKCCCCASLRTGCLIIAILSLLSSIATIFGSGGNLVGGDHGDAEKNKVTYQANMILKGLICAVSILLCIALIYGTVKKNRKLLKAWVILKGIECVLVLLMIGKLIYAVVIAHSREKGIVAGILVGVIIEFILCCYCWLVVWSHYLELGDEETAALGALSQIILLFVNVGGPLYGQDAAYGSQIASCVLSFIVGLTVLWAVHSRNKNFLLPYLVLRMISWFLINFAIGAFIVLTITSQKYLFLLFIAIFIISSALTYYFWRCVLSFYFELVDAINTSRLNI